MKTWIASWKPYFSLYRLKAMQETQYRAAALGALIHSGAQEAAQAALASFYGDWLNIGGGLSKLSVLAYGAIPSIANDFSDKSLLLPSGAIINGKFDQVLPVNLTNPEEIQETVNHSWYKTYPAGKTGLHPWDGITEPHYNPGPNIKGTPTDLKQVDERDRYSWLKTPLWRGHQKKSEWSNVRRASFQQLLQV
mgnify:CR=1 FL=1